MIHVNRHVDSHRRYQDLLGRPKATLPFKPYSHAEYGHPRNGAQPTLILKVSHFYFEDFFPPVPCPLKRKTELHSPKITLWANPQITHKVTSVTTKCYLHLQSNNHQENVSPRRRSKTSFPKSSTDLSIWLKMFLFWRLEKNVNMGKASQGPGSQCARSCASRVKELEGTMPRHSCPALRGALVHPLRATSKVSLALVKTALRLEAKVPQSPFLAEDGKNTLEHRTTCCDCCQLAFQRSQMPRAGISSVWSTARAEAGMQGYST